jgi:hypothetical protein
MSLFPQDLPAMDDWEDPNPAPQIIVHDGIHVVRDDLLEIGTKVRGADYLIKTSSKKEWVYGGMATGYAPISIAHVCKKYGKKAVIFAAKRKPENIHPFQRRSIELGAEYKWLPMGMLTVVNARARNYVAEDPENRALVPFGLNHPLCVASMVKVMKALPIKPKEIWSVAGSGTISRSLQIAFPDAEVHAVCTGHKLTEEERGRAIVHISSYKYNQNVKKDEAPPFPSIAAYDAKAWQPMLDWHREHERKDPVLFWNVGAE